MHQPRGRHAHPQASRARSLSPARIKQLRTGTVQERVHRRTHSTFKGSPLETSDMRTGSGIVPWERDESTVNCRKCNKQFTFFKRRHHCRRCGLLYCSSCSSARAQVKGHGRSPCRVCDVCR